jgi:hypothetical protein
MILCFIGYNNAFKLVSASFFMSGETTKKIKVPEPSDIVVREIANRLTAPPAQIDYGGAFTTDVRKGVLYGARQNDGFVIQGVVVPRQTSDRLSSNVDRADLIASMGDLPRDNVVLGIAQYVPKKVSGEVHLNLSPSTELIRQFLARQNEISYGLAIDGGILTCQSIASERKPFYEFYPQFGTETKPSNDRKEVAENPDQLSLF